jgi:hypothetical protein
MPLLYQERCIRLSPVGQEPSQPVPQANEELFPQTSQPGMHGGWDEVA